MAGWDGLTSETPKMELQRIVPGVTEQERNPMTEAREGFIMTVAVAQLFYQICGELGIEDYESKMRLLRILVKEKQAGYLRDVDEYCKDKRVLKIRSKHGKA